MLDKRKGIWDLLGSLALQRPEHEIIVMDAGSKAIAKPARARASRETYGIKDDLLQLMDLADESFELDGVVDVLHGLFAGRAQEIDLYAGFEVYLWVVDLACVEFGLGFAFDAFLESREGVRTHLVDMAFELVQRELSGVAC